VPPKEDVLVGCGSSTFEGCSVVPVVVAGREAIGAPRSPCLSVDEDEAFFGRMICCVLFLTMAPSPIREEPFADSLVAALGATFSFCLT